MLHGNHSNKSQAPSERRKPTGRQHWRTQTKLLAPSYAAAATPMPQQPCSRATWQRDAGALRMRTARPPSAPP